MNESTFRGVVHKKVNTQKGAANGTKGQFLRIFFFLVVFIVFTILIYQKMMNGVTLQNIHLNEFPLLQKLADNSSISDVRESIIHKIEEFTHLVGDAAPMNALQKAEDNKNMLLKVKAFHGRVEKSLGWISKLQPDAPQLRWDLTSNADVHLLHKLGSYLKRVLATDFADGKLKHLIDKGYQCSPWQTNLQEVISKKISMDICSEVEWYKVVHLAWPEAKDFMDIGANKGYLGSLFLSLWGGGDLGVSPITIFDLSKKLQSWKDSRNPAGYCKDGFNYGIPLFCDTARHPSTGQCSGENLDIHITSIDGSAYLKETLTNMITKEVPNKKAAKLWQYLNFAMSDQKGTVRFTKQDKDKNAGFEGGSIKKLSDVSPDTVEVNMTSVDLFMSEHGIPHLDLLKIDTEGNDNKVIMGAKNAITNHLGMITFEGGKGVTLSKEMIADFDSLGFSCYSTSRAGLFKWNGGCMKEQYMGGFAAKDKGNIFCVSRLRAPMVTLAYDILSFPMMIEEYLDFGGADDITQNKWKNEETSASVQITDLVPVYVNIKPFCKPWPSCAQLK